MDIKKAINNSTTGGRDLYSTPDSAIRNGTIQDNAVANSLVDRNMKYFSADNRPIISNSKKALQRAKDERVARGAANNDINFDISEEDIQYKKAVQQGVGEKFLNSVLQLGINEIFLGTLKSFGDIYDAVTHLRKPGDFTNPYSEYFEKLQEQYRERRPIYQKSYDPGFHFNDAGWIANGLTNIGSTLSLMLPGKAVTGLGKLTRIDRIGKGIISKSVRAANKASKGRIFKYPNEVIQKSSLMGQSFTEAVMSRMAEGYQEGRETYKMAYQDTKAQLDNMTDEEFDKFVYDNGDNFKGLSKEEIAAKIATQSGSLTYWNDYVMLLMDIPQMYAINKMFKGTGKINANNAVYRAQQESVAGLSGETINNVYGWGKPMFTKAYWKSAGRLAKETFSKPLSSWEALELGEGIEEGYQAIQSQRGRELANLYLNPYAQRKSVIDYLTDKEVVENAFWGVIGGIGFKWASKGIKRGYEGYQYLTKRNKLSKDQLQNLRFGEQNRRIADIRGRKKILDDYIGRQKILDRGEDYTDIEKDAKGNTIKDANGNIQFKKITDPNLLSLRKRQNAEEAIRELTMNAAINGNIDLLKEYMLNPQFKTYLAQNGIQIDEMLDGGLQQAMKEAENDFYQAKSDITDNADEADNIYIIDIAAKNLARARRQKRYYDKAIEDVNTEISLETRDNTDYTSDENYYYKEALKEAIEAHLQLLDQAKDAFAQQFREDEYYSKAAYESDIANVNRKIKELVKQYSEIDSDFIGLENLSEFLTDNGLKVNDSTINAIKNELNKYISTRNRPSEPIDNKVQNLLFEKADLQVGSWAQQTELPENNKDENRYQHYYDAEALAFTDIAKNKFGRALKIVQDYFEKAEDLDAALATLKNTDNKKLRNAYDILKFGSEDSKAFTIALQREVEKERKRRNQREEKENTVVKEDTKQSPNKSKSITERIKESTSSSTGVEQRTQTNPVTQQTEIKEEPQVTSGKVTVEQLDNINTVDLRENSDLISPNQDKSVLMGSDAMAVNLGVGTDLSTNKQVVDLANKTAREIVNKNRQLWINVVREGIGSSAYNEMINQIVDVLEQNVLYLGDIRDAAEQGLAVYINSVKFLTNKGTQIFSRPEDAEKFSKLAAQILALTTGTKYNEQNSTFDDIDDIEKKEAAENLLQDYAIAQRLISTNGVIEIDVAQLFSYLQELADKNSGIDYNEVLQTYLMFKDAINMLQDNKNFSFVNTKILDKNVNVFLDMLYRNKSETVTTDDYFGVKVSSDLNQEKDKRKVIDSLIGSKVEYRYSKFNNISIYARDKKGNIIEIGYISKVQPNQDNTSYTIQNSDNYTITKTSDGYEHTLDDIIYYILNTEEDNIVWNYLKNFYIQGNSNRYSGKQMGDARDFTTDLNNIIKFINNQTIANYLENKYYYENINGKRIKSDENVLELVNKALNENRKYDAIRYISSSIHSITDILFYELNSRSIQNAKYTIDDRQTLRDSYELYKEKVFKNYEETYSIQRKLNAGETPVGILQGHNAKALDYSETKDISKIGLIGKVKTETNGETEFPFAYVDGDVIYENGKSSTNRAGFRPHTTAIVLQESRNSGIGQTGMANLALLVEANKVSDTSSELTVALKTYLTDILNDYFSKMRDKSLPVNVKNEAFENLYVSLRDLFGNTTNKLFNKFFILTNDAHNYIAIATQGEKDINIRAVFHKYGGQDIKQDSGVYRDKTTNEILTQSELDTKITGALTFNDVEKVISNNQKDQEKAVFNKFIDTLVSETTYNDTNFAIKHANESDVSGKHISKRNKKIVVTIGKFEKEYNSFSQFIVLNNAFKTNVAGNNVVNIYDEDNSRDLTRLYIENTTTTTPVKEEEHKAIKQQVSTFQDWLNKNKKRIGATKAISTEEFLRNSGSDIQEVEAILAKDKELKQLTGGLSLIPDEVYIGGKSRGEERAVRNKQTGKISIRSKGVDAIKSNPHDAIRLSIHENVHNIVAAEKYFKGKIGKNRISELKETYDLFYEKYKDDQSSIGKFARQFHDLYGKNADEEFANEWIAEVLSNRGLTEALNNIDSGETIIVDGEQKPKTLLAKILDFITKIFVKAANIKDNSVLAKVYYVLNDSVSSQVNDGSLTLFDKYNNPINITDSSPTNSLEAQVVEEQVEETKVPETKETVEEEQQEEEEEEEEDEEENNDNEDFSVIDDINPYDTDIEKKLNSFANDKTNNPYGFSEISDMETYLQKFRPSERSAVRSALTAGEMTYVCR